MKKVIKIKKKNCFLYRLTALLCVSLLLLGCAGRWEEIKEEAKQPIEEQTASDQVIEAGMVVDCTDPYAVVSFEVFSRQAGECSAPVVVELHDCREGYEVQKAQLELLNEHGIDLLLMDVTKGEESQAHQQELAQLIAKLNVPVIYFGTPPQEETLEVTGGTYVGLSEEEAAEYEAIRKEDRFEESGYREKAKEAGETLLNLVLEMMQ